MTVNELIIELHELSGDMEVRIAQQPRYPVQTSISSVEIAKNAEGEDTVYLLEGSSMGYGPHGVWR